MMIRNHDYDAADVFKSEIEPLLKELDKICYTNRIPMFFTCATGQQEGIVHYESAMVSAEKAKRSLNNNRIAHHVRVLNGYNTISARDDETVEFT